MMFYKANRYYTTMNYDTFLILGTDVDTLNKANDLFMEVIDEDNEVSMDDLHKFVSDNDLIYIDDVNSPMETGVIHGTNIHCAIKDEVGYLYEIIYDFTSRF